MAASRPTDRSSIPDIDTNFTSDRDIAAFEAAINAPDAAAEESRISVLSDWIPVHERIRRRRAKKSPGKRGKDETREGFMYQLVKWPLLVIVLLWILILFILYGLTRLYVSQYEYWITWRGRREKLRQKLRTTRTYSEWKNAAKRLDAYLGADAWKAQAEFAYYDYKTVGRLVDDLRWARTRAEREAMGLPADEEDEEDNGDRKEDSSNQPRAVEQLRDLIEACVKSNFAGIESPRLYSQTYYGTKDKVQEFVEEVELSLRFLIETDSLGMEEKRVLFKHLHHNYGKTAICLSGGATFAFYHFGVVKALLDADLLPTVITGTSGGALVAALVCTRTNEDLKKVLVPGLAEKLTACHEATISWLFRWCRTGARFDAIDWAQRLSWFTKGSMTFKEAYELSGRILNISCVSSDPHSPSLLLNYLTAPDCCIFSAVLASCAVPGVLNPVMLMAKPKFSKTITPYSFGHKWKDGSLRTDIPLKALNTYFNVTFSIVSQVNPHVNIFFFSARGSVGHPVTHRRGKGWRGGFIGSAIEQYLKLDLAKWLKVLRHLELLPRLFSQDWSMLFLQKFDGNITIWPRPVLSDFYYVLSNPSPARLERMLGVGQRSAWAKMKFLSNRLRIERLVEEGRRNTRAYFNNKLDHEEDSEPEYPPPQSVMNPYSSSSAAASASTLRMKRKTPTPARSEAATETENKEMGGFAAATWFMWNSQQQQGPEGVQNGGLLGDLDSEEPSSISVTSGDTEEVSVDEADVVGGDDGGGVESFVAAAGAMPIL